MIQPRFSLKLTTLVLLISACLVRAQNVTSPEEHLGRPLGTDFKLADWKEVSSWYHKLGQESPNVVTRKIGTTTEGRDFLISVISSPDNLNNLERLQRYAAIIADPRGHSEEAKREAVERGKVILLVSPQMHSTEAAGTEAAMKFVHALATSEEEPWASARKNLVVGVFACTNPDGLDHVVSWYRKYVGTPYEASAMLQLYQQYTGHDNNRDWFMLTQAETRIVTEQLYTVWRPQVYWDIHQQGNNRERMFVPPYRDPLNPNLDSAIITGIGTLGSRALYDMTRDGLTGISTGVSYDMW
ncbi:MAG: M14 family zinc carboxypeptidase, partial [Limisphaerales bacterium]